MMNSTSKSEIVVAMAVLMPALALVGCALTLTPSPSDGSVGLPPSPANLSVEVTTNTAFVNNTNNGTATSLSAILDGTQVNLVCGSRSNCSLSRTFAPGAHSLSVTALVAWPAFYTAPGNSPVACNVSYNRVTVTQCYTLNAKTVFGVGCTHGALTVANPTLIPTPTGQAASYQLVAQGGCPAYVWTVSNSTSLPPGISISASGLVSGTETAACTPDHWTYDTTIRVTDGLGDTGGAGLSFNICSQ